MLNQLEKLVQVDLKRLGAENDFIFGNRFDFKEILIFKEVLTLKPCFDRRYRKKILLN